MSQVEIRESIVAALTDVAPEIEPEELTDDLEYREEFEIDSMDFLNFVVAVGEQYEIDIPEEDYPELATIGGFVAYVARSQ